ncbi:hypothetical protein HELRODRAFT_192145 [Helobdella robusta]|uniref:Uncharacterized protein n=1 Tax=Helobdella robusta TaxID=6412 RepID=T1FTM5_HELRO|nr:hypothetical protein HELRODRAFT_192145 [Helobdella robusta]ESO02748.1 hypothetical protein HELRODRAFT_192145 [Helobdella robusta]
MMVIDDGESRQDPLEDCMDDYIIRDSVNSSDETTNQELHGDGREKSRFEDAELHNEQQNLQQQSPPQQQQQSQRSETHFIKSKRINFIEPDNPDVQVIRDFYGLLHFPVENLMIEKLGTYPHRLYYVSDFVKNVISSNHDSYAFPRAGVKMFNYRSKDDTSCKFIICQEGLPLLYKFMTKRIINCSKKDFVVLARSSRLLMYNLTANMQNKLNKLVLLLLLPCVRHHWRDPDEAVASFPTVAKLPTYRDGQFRDQTENGCFAVVYNPRIESNVNASNQSETINAPVDDSVNSEDDFFALVCLKTEHAYVALTSEYLRKYYLQRLSVPSHEMEAFRPSNSCKEALVNFAFYLEQAGL